MENRELLKKLNFIVKEINDTHTRLQRAQENLQEIESALLTQQVVNLYQHLQRLQDFYRKARLQGTSIPEKTIERKPASQPQEIKQKPEPQAAAPGIQNQQQTTTPTPQAEKKEQEAVASFTRQEIKAEQTPPKEVPKNEAPAAEKPVFNFSTSASRMEEKPAPEPQKETSINTYTAPETKQEVANQAEPEPVVPPQPKTEPTPLAETNTFLASEAVPEKQEPISQEKPVTEGRSINERFAQQQVKKNLADKLKLSPIKDIKSAMSLNQRISFIKNLFKGNDEEFTKTVSFINNLKSFNEAKFYIQSEVSNKNGWDEENPLVQEFMELVYRKFV